LRPEDYVAMIQDAVMMRKNVCILRHFENFTPKSAGIKHNYYIDVWPLCVRFNEEFDDTFTLMMQLACVLHMKDTWKTSTHVRIYIISDGHSE
jgi:potassium/chloride transporter 9